MSAWSATIPCASRRSWVAARSRVYCWKSRTAIAVETTPDRTMPARKIAGRRKRREWIERSKPPSGYA